MDVLLCSQHPGQNGKGRSKRLGFSNSYFVLTKLVDLSVSLFAPEAAQGKNLSGRSITYCTKI